LYCSLLFGLTKEPYFWQKTHRIPTLFKKGVCKTFNRIVEKKRLTEEDANGAEVDVNPAAEDSADA